MGKQILVYKNVYSRKETKYYDLLKYIEQPMDILSDFGVTEDDLKNIKATEDKQDRNELKRQKLPAVDFSMCGLLTIDIDGISDDKTTKNRIIDVLSKTDTCYLLQETASGNVVAFFKYDCKVGDFQFLYYKIYLEMTLLLSVSIDFLPEINRLRYLNAGEIYHLNESCKVLTKILKVDNLPYINTKVTKDKARRVVYGSK